MKYLGEYQYKFNDGKVYLPEKFQMADKDLTMRIIDDEGFLCVQIWDEMGMELLQVFRCLSEMKK